MKSISSCTLSAAHSGSSIAPGSVSGKNAAKRPPTSMASAAVSRQIVRLCNLCWDAMLEAGEVEQYLGKPIRDLRAPNEMIFYLAFLVHFDKPFYHVVQHVPTLLF